MRMTKLIAPRLKSQQIFSKLKNYKTAKLLEELSFVNSEGTNTVYMPLGTIIKKKIENYLRSEVEKFHFQEIEIGTLQYKDLFEMTDRFEKFKEYIYSSEEFVLIPTTEEPICNIMSSMNFSYKELPMYIFGFRRLYRKSHKNQAIRASQFKILDAYSFEINQDSIRTSEKEIFIPIIKNVLNKLKINYVEIDKNQNYKDFRIITEDGDDPIYIGKDGEVFDKPPVDIETEKKKSLSLAVVMNLGDSYSKIFGLEFSTSKNTHEPIFVGSFAIGIERLFYSMAEQLRSKKEPMIFNWPNGFEPFDFAILEVPGSDASKFYENAKIKCKNVLYDDTDKNIGLKVRRSYAIGIPEIIIVGQKEIETGIVSVERKGEKKYDINFDRYLSSKSSYNS